MSEPGWSAQYQSARHTDNMTGYRDFVEVGFRINNITVAIRLPHVRLRRFWRKKKTQITSLSSSSSSSSPSSSSSSSSEDWIRDFHARYNPLQTERSPYTTSTPVRTHITTQTLNLTGVKIYEDFEDLEGILEETDTSFDVVNVNNIVIAKAVFPTLRSHKNSIP